MFSLKVAFLFVLAALPALHCKAQRPIRKHFLVLYEATLYVRSTTHKELMTKVLPDLFGQKGELATGPDSVDQARLAIEPESTFEFFDPSQDAISFYHLGLSAADQQNLMKSSGELNPQNRSLLLAQYMVRFQLMDDEFGGDLQPAASAAHFFAKAKQRSPKGWSYPAKFAMPDLAPQMALMNLVTDTYAQEYIVVVVSESPSLGRQGCLERLPVIFGETNKAAGTRVVSDVTSARIAEMESAIKIQPYFSFNYLLSWGQADVHLQGFRLMPMINGGLEGTSLTVEGGSYLTKDLGEKDKYQISACELDVPELRGLKVEQVWVNLYKKQSYEFGDRVFSGPVAKLQSGQTWTSDYTQDAQLMAFADGQYQLPSLQIPLPEEIKKGTQRFKLEHLLLSQLEVKGMAEPMKVALESHQILEPDQVTHRPMPGWVPKVIIFLLVSAASVYCFILFRKQRPLSIRLAGSSLTETYMSLDNTGLGRQSTPYRVWEGPSSPQAGFKLDLRVLRNPHNRRFRISRTLSVMTADAQVPAGFEVFLTQQLQDFKEYSKGFALLSKEQKKDGSVPVYLHVRQQNLALKVDAPLQIKVKLDCSIKPLFGFLGKRLHHEALFTFHIGPDLGDLWMGFDPGTTGTVTAVGTTALNVSVCTDQYGEPIEPSVVSFDKKTPYQEGQALHTVPHFFGTEAFRRLELPGFAHYLSMKKLLGYRDVKEINFDSGHTLKLSGKELATLLVKGVYSHSKQFLTRPEVRANLQARGSATEPTRAVVAIPNNFTLPKIRDMVDCIAAAGQFAEIRYIHEAEAVLFYYLSRFGKLCPGEEPPPTETVLVFDMGGATINATVVTVKRMSAPNEAESYHVSLDAKTGYGIGGDTIDYCLIKHLMEAGTEFPQLKSVSFQKNKNALSAFALKLKAEIITNYKADADALISSYKLSDLIHDHFGVKLIIEERSSSYYSAFKKTGGRYPLLFGGLLREIVYDNIMDAVKEVLELAGKPVVDRVIFSGRSTAFPMVGAGVMWAVNGKEGKTPFLRLELEESKIAVAMGCCWYGINRKAIHMSPPKTSSSIGVRQTLTADGSQIKYLELVPIGNTFPMLDGNPGMLEGTKPVSSDFALDGGQVCFLQVMGKDAVGIISRNEKHKFSNLIRIPLATRSTLIGARVWDYDLVQCVVRQEDGTLKELHASVADQEIAEANEEHYTWTVN